MIELSEVIIVHYGEIGLKGRNRGAFIARLQENLEHKLRCLGLHWPVHHLSRYFGINVPENSETELNTLLVGLGEVAGVVWYSPAQRLDAEAVGLISEAPDYGLIEERVAALAQSHFKADASFCVRVNRAEKRFPLTSPQLETRLGQAIIDETAWNVVDLERPDHTFYVDVQPEGVYLYTKKWRGVGGLPVGSSGHVLALLSGGIDSPVAAYLAAKRGCTVDFIHFTATRLQQQDARDYKVSRLAAVLSRTTMHSSLYLIPYVHFELAILGKEVDYELIIFRRFMARVAEQLAARVEALALVTGDNLGQVASQTLENLVSTSEGVAMPMLRPLLTFDKQETIRLARRIGSYDLSVQPYKDCCSILDARPRTKSYDHWLSRREESLLPDYDVLLRRSLDDALCLEYECGALVESGRPFGQSA